MIFTNTGQIESILKKDIDKKSKIIKIFAGHLPLRYESRDLDDPKVYLDVHRWGFFSQYTFELGVQLMRYVLDQGKEGKLMVVVDDDCEITAVEKEDKEKRDDNKYRTRRREAMAITAFPELYHKILASYNLDISHLVTQKRKKFTTVLLSEKILKDQAKTQGFTSKDPCSKAYKGLLLTNMYFNKETDYLISFLPEQCKGSICSGVLNEYPGLQASHVFFPDVEALGALLKLPKGGYTESKKRKPLTLEEAFREGKISYRKD